MRSQREDNESQRKLIVERERERESERGSTRGQLESNENLDQIATYLTQKEIVL